MVNVISKESRNQCGPGLCWPAASGPCAADVALQIYLVLGYWNSRTATNGLDGEEWHLSYLRWSLFSQNKKNEWS